MGRGWDGDSGEGTGGKLGEDGRMCGEGDKQEWMSGTFECCNDVPTCECGEGRGGMGGGVGRRRDGCIDYLYGFLQNHDYILRPITLHFQVAG